MSSDSYSTRKSSRGILKTRSQDNKERDDKK